MNRRREIGFVGEVVGHHADRYLTLPVRLLVNGSRDRSSLEVRGHLREQVRGYQLYFSGQTSRSQGPAHRQTVDGIHVQACKGWNAAEQIECFLETFVLI